MQVRPKKLNKRKITLIIIIILLLVGGVFTYLYASRPFDSSVETPNESLDINKSTDENKISTPEAKSKPGQPTSKEPTKVEGKTPIQYEGEKISDEPMTDNEQFRIPEDQ